MKHHIPSSPIVYVSGPITAKTALEIERNVRVAEEASARLFEAGVTNICVHAQCRFMDGLLDHQEWLQHDFNLLGRCDAMYVCVDSFFTSRGTVAEIAFCRENGVPVYYASDFDALVAWARRKTAVTAAGGANA